MGSDVWNYDPISRGLKWWPRDRNALQVWNYDPISRGLKLFDVGLVSLYLGQMFGTMTRFLGD